MITNKIVLVSERVGFIGSNLSESLLENNKDVLCLNNPTQEKKEISQVEVIHGPERLGDITHSHASVEKSKKNLGYKPTHDLQKVLKEAVDWCWGYFNSRN